MSICPGVWAAQFPETPIEEVAVDRFSRVSKRYAVREELPSGNPSTSGRAVFPCPSESQRLNVRERLIYPGMLSVALPFPVSGLGEQIGNQSF